MRGADNLTAICEPIVLKMWEPRLLTLLWAFTACYRNSFTFYKLLICSLCNFSVSYKTYFNIILQTMSLQMVPVKLRELFAPHRMFLHDLFISTLLMRREECALNLVISPMFQMCNSTSILRTRAQFIGYLWIHLHVLNQMTFLSCCYCSYVRNNSTAHRKYVKYNVTHPRLLSTVLLILTG
jgi:hypothetical protein